MAWEKPGWVLMALVPHAPLGNILLASSATIGERKGDGHLQWVQESNIPKVFTNNQIKAVIEQNREQRGLLFGSSCRNSSDIGPEKIKSRTS